MITWIHIFAGMLAIGSGAVAMLAAKGSALHRQAGSWFVFSMLAMTGSAALVSFFLRIDHVTGVVALFTAYLVTTSWLAVKRSVEQSRKALLGLALAAIALGVYALSRWLDFQANPQSLITKNSPPQTLLVFGLVSLIAAALDLRLCYVKRLVGAQRLVRHLWRMCFAMLIATGSLFAGQMQVFPAMLRKASVVGLPLLLLPVLLVLLSSLYWLGRTLFSGKRC